MHQEVTCGGGRVGVEMAWGAPVRGGDGAEIGDNVQQGVREGGSSHCQGGSRSGDGGIAHCWEHDSLMMTGLSLGNLDHRFPHNICGMLSTVTGLKIAFLSLQLSLETLSLLLAVRL